MSGKLEDLKQELERKLAQSRQGRVGHEVNNLVGQIHARSIFFTLLRVLPDSALIWASWIFAFQFFKSSAAMTDCAQISLTGGISDGCIQDQMVTLYFICAAFLLFVASTISTLIKKSARFQHSALLNVYIILSIIYQSSKANWSSALTIFLIVASFFIMFAGYRLAFRIPAIGKK